MQRTGVFAELAPLLREQGMDPAALLARAGIGSIPPSPDAMLPFGAALQALAMAAELTACPQLGLVLGQRFRLAHHGVICELMSCAPTLGRALLDFTAWQPGYSSGAVVYLHRMGEEHAFGYGATGMGSPILYDLVAMIGVRMVEQLTGGAASPEEVHLPQRKPAYRTEYARYMNVPVRFNQERVCLVLSSAALETRLPHADHARHEAQTAGLRARMKSSGASLTLRTRHALRLVLQRGSPTMEAVAAELAMHPRTLRRHLAKEQTSFEALCDALRFDMARELLDLTDLPVNEIGMALAYASPSVFADAFRRCSSLSPMAFRHRNNGLRQGSAAG